MRAGQTAEKTLVVGLGISGRAVCALLRSRGAKVTATDLRSRSEFKDALNSIEQAGCLLRLGSHRLEDFLAIAVTDAAERRVIRHFVRQREPTKPSIGEVVMDILAKLPVRLDAVQVCHQEHPEKDFRIDGRSSHS